MLKLISMIGSVIDKAQKDHVTAFSAQAAFFTILSFFPFMIVLLSLTRYFPITPNDMIELVRTYLPPKYSGMVVPIIRSLNGKLTTTYMSITILTLLWSASKGILSLMTGLNTIHEIPEKRNYFVLRFISSIYIGLFAIAVLFGLILLLFGIPCSFSYIALNQSSRINMYFLQRSVFSLHFLHLWSFLSLCIVFYRVKISKQSRSFLEHFLVLLHGLYYHFSFQCILIIFLSLVLCTED